MADELLKWSSVYFYPPEGSQFSQFGPPCIRGTLFLYEKDSSMHIQWVPDDERDNYSFTLPLSELRQIARARSRGTLTGTYKPKNFYFAYLRNGRERHYHGPFELSEENSKGFLSAISKYCELGQNHNDKNLYDVRLRQTTLSADYDLPIFGNSQNQKIKMAITSLGYNLVQAATNNFGLTNMNLNRPGLVETRFRSREENGFQIVDQAQPPPELPARKTFSRGPVFDHQEWEKHLSEGRVTCVDALKQKVFDGGIEATLRPILWKYLLDYFDWNLTMTENEVRKQELAKDYLRMKRVWMDMSQEQRKRWSKFTEWKVLIEKDVFRTDRKIPFFQDNKHGNLTKLHDILVTYLFYNQDLGYLQGMNDLLAIIMYVMETEEDSFWCFVGLMNRMERNFSDDMQGLRTQFSNLFSLLEVLENTFNQYLYENHSKDMPFCLKWFLIHFKREFSYDGAMELWEVFWSCPHTKNFHLFFAAAILSQQKDAIMNDQLDVNSILKFINELSGHIDLHKTLNLALALFHQIDEIKVHLSKDLNQIVYGPSLCASPHMKPDSSTPGIVRERSSFATEEHEWDLPVDQQEALSGVFKGVSIISSDSSSSGPINGREYNHQQSTSSFVSDSVSSLTTGSDFVPANSITTPTTTIVRR